MLNVLKFFTRLDNFGDFFVNFSRGHRLMNLFLECASAALQI